MIITLLIILLCAIFAIWIVTKLPASVGGFPVQTVGYVFVGAATIYLLLHFARLI